MSDPQPVEKRSQLSTTTTNETLQVLSLVTNRYATFYRNQVAALGRQDIEITHCYPPTQSDFGEGKGPTKDLSRSASEYLRMYRALLPESVGNYDLVHANNGLMAPFALAQPCRPVVLTLWGTDLMGRYGRVTERLCSFVDEIVVPSQEMAAGLDRDGTVIPFGIDMEQFSPTSKRVAREKLGWDTDRPIVLFPAAPSRPVKNYPLAESVVNALSVDAELKTFFDTPHERVPLYMNASDCVLITSNRESGPMVLKEAVVCNAPVVSTDVGFAAEILEPVSNSFACDSRCELVERVEQVLASDSRADGREVWADHFGLDRMGRRLRSVYDRALE